MQVLPRDPKYLSLANHMCRLDALNYRPRCRLRARSLHGPKPSLDGAVVRFDPVVTVASCSLAATAMQLTFFLQFVDGRRIAAQPVAREHSRRPVIRIRESAF